MRSVFHTVGIMRPNVVLVTIDALRAKHLGCFGYERSTTPSIDKIAAEGTLFVNALSNGPTTPFSFPSILASVHSFQLEGIGISEEVLTLAEVLQSHGYATAGITPNDYTSRAYGYAAGFQHFSDPQQAATERDRIRRRAKSIVRWSPRLFRFLRMLSNEILGSSFSYTERTADELLGESAEWLATVPDEDNFFVWCHLNDVHHPWIPRSEYLKEFTKQEVRPKEAKRLVDQLLLDPDDVWSAVSEQSMQTILALYDSAISYVDFSLGAFVKEHVDLTDTILIVTSDHGEEFGEHGGFHRNKPYEEMLHVPLIMAGPGVPRGSVVSESVSLIDLAPTLLDLCSLSQETRFQGEILRPLLEGEKAERNPLIASYNRRLLESGELEPKNDVFVFRDGPWKLIARSERKELYNLQTDPHEEVDLIDVHPELASNLEQDLRSEIERLGYRGFSGASVELDDATKNRLRALGYLQ